MWFIPTTKAFNLEFQNESYIWKLYENNENKNNKINNGYGVTFTSSLELSILRQAMWLRILGYKPTWYFRAYFLYSD